MKVLFPEPIRLGKQRRWRLSGLREYEAALAGKPAPAPLDPAAEQYLTAAQIQERYCVSDMWIWRRLAERNCEAA